MIKVKNVQSGIVIIADAGIKMGPGDVVEVNNLTPQALKAIDDGLITRVDTEQNQEPKHRSRTAAKVEELKLESQPATSEPVKTDPGDKNGAG
ncbi:MAG: hypothetical protein ACYC27_19670 [Armatimonadota bacterium]